MILLTESVQFGFVFSTSKRCTCTTSPFCDAVPISDSFSAWQLAIDISDLLYDFNRVTDISNEYMSILPRLYVSIVSPDN